MRDLARLGRARKDVRPNIDVFTAIPGWYDRHLKS
jgi:hypothetical protein